jgi:hypothetical protein
MKKLLTVIAVSEALSGLVLFIFPQIVVRLLFGAEIAGAGVVMSRIAGVILIALGLACWPGPALIGMLTYSVLVTVYLAYLGIQGEWVGSLLGPAVVVHAILTIPLAAAWLRDPQSKKGVRS